MTPEIAAAIDEIRESVPGRVVEATEDGQGGAYVIVRDLDIGATYVPPRTWCGFQITFQYPRADVYPHFVDGKVVRTDGKPHGGGIGSGVWQSMSVLQLSRRSNRWDAEVDTAATKLAKVLDWFRAL
jgi:hypothetical protein